MGEGHVGMQDQCPGLGGDLTVRDLYRDDFGAGRLEGLNLVDNYAQAAADLFRLELLSEDEARMVMTTVVTGGEITDAELPQCCYAS